MISIVKKCNVQVEVLVDDLHNTQLHHIELKINDSVLRWEIENVVEAQAHLGALEELLYNGLQKLTMALASNL